MAVEATLNDRSIQALLRSIKDRIKKVDNGVGEYVKFVAPIAQKDVAKHFTDEKGSSGRWQSWSVSYSDFLKRAGLSGDMLARTGKLRNSVIPAIGIKGRPSEIPILVNKAKTKNGFPYAAAHDVGGGRLPQREFMWLSGGALETMAKATLQFALKEK